jgi:asparagine synthase (glutamine-hydrolysing)
MCGICGIVLADPNAEVSANVIERMSDTIAHRGPDDSGQYLNGPVGFGFRRLSIIDLAGGHQPMSNEDGSVWIVYNGEIYNHAEQRGPLEAKGHVFRTRCDTEVIVHQYEEMGAACAGEMRGMFGFAIWDDRKKRLVLARDHSGIKPVFYAITQAGDIVFGSEIKAVLASGMVDAELDERAVSEYFALGLVSGDRTLYRDVRKLEPGSTLVWQDGRVRVERYWRAPAYVPGSRSPVDLGQAASEYWGRFVESVGIMLMSDVPLGVFLSGGIDSSLLVAAMRELGVDELRTFSVGFAEAEASELPFARIVASTFRTEHHEVMCDADQFFEALPRLTRHRDHPLTFSASIPLFFVSELAASSVKVVLTGEGSDELFAGYGRYPRALLNTRGARALDAALPRSARRALAGAVGRLGDDFVGNRLKRSFLARGASFEEAYLDPFADFDAEHRAALLGPDLAREAYGRLNGLIDRELSRVNPLEAMLRFDQATYLEELLAKQDQMSMAASLESRVPFLDHHLIEWASQLSPDLKLHGTSGKALVRLAAERVLPRSITHARKRGFLVPLARWLRDRGPDVLEEYLPNGGDFLSRSYIERLVAEHRAGRDHTARLWRILAFQVWRREALADATSSAAALSR